MSSKSNMKKSPKGEVVLSSCQLQAARLNKLEHRRLQSNVNNMEDNLKFHLTRLQRQAQDIRYHYTNVVRVVKPNPRYQLWKQKHAYEIAQEEPRIRPGLMKTKQVRQQLPALSETSSESSRPLLLLAGNETEKTAEPLINFGHSFLRPKTSPANKFLRSPTPTMLNEQSSSPVRSKQSEYNTNIFAPILGSGGTQKYVQSRSNLFNTQKGPNLDTLYRIALQNQTACNSIEQTHIDKRKLLDKEFASQHRALRATIRSATLVR